MWYFSNSRMRHSNDWAGVDPTLVPKDYQYHLTRNKYEAERVVGADADALIDGGSFCAGDPDACARTVERYAQLGIDQLMPIFQAGRTPHEEIMTSIRLFGEQVIPRFIEKSPSPAADAVS